MSCSLKPKSGLVAFGSTSRLTVASNWFSTGRFELSSNSRPKLRRLPGLSVLKVMPALPWKLSLMPLAHSLKLAGGT